MATAAAKVRLVRCPKCRNVLPELPDLAVYMCGGCGTVLQAKKRKNGSSGSLENGTQKNQLVLDSQDVKLPSSGQIENQCEAKECSSYLNAKEQHKSTDCSIEPSGSRNFLSGVSSRELERLSDLNGEKQLEHDSEDVRSTRSSQIGNHCDTKECSSNFNEKEQVESMDSSIEPSGSRNFLVEVSSGEAECSSDLNAEEQLENQLEHDSEDVKSTSSGQIENHPNTKERPSNLNAKEQIESTDCSFEPSGNRNFLSGVSSGELECSSDLNGEDQLENQLKHDSEDAKSTSSGRIENHPNAKECSNLNVKEEIESTDCSIEPSGSGNFLMAVSSGDSECLSDMNAKEKIESINCNIEPSRGRNFISDPLDPDTGKEQIEYMDGSFRQSGSRSFFKEVASSDPRYHEMEEKSSEVGWNTQADENDESQSPDGQLSSRGKSSSFTGQRQSDENNPTKICSASSNKQLQLSHGISYHEFDQTRAIETIEASGAIDNGNISEELSVTFRNISKSPTARSSHAYDGSISSCDGWNDKVPEKPPNLPKRSRRKDPVVSDFASNKERPRREDGLMNRKIIDNPELEDELRKFFSMSSDEKNGLAVMDGMKWEGSRIQAEGQAGSPDSDSLQPIMNRMTSVSDEFWSRQSSQTGFSTVYENSPLNEEVSFRTSASNAGQVDYIEKMELLRKVDELREQLSRSYNQRRMANGMSPASDTQEDKQQSLYYRPRQLDPEVPYWYDANHHRQHPHVPFRTRNNGCHKCEFSPHFSGQGTTCINHVDFSCDHHGPEDWQCQAQLPPSSTFCSGGPSSRDHSGQMFYRPYSSSSASRPLNIDSYLSLTTHSLDQGHVVHDLQKKYLQNRHQPSKRHCRPIAGGAPFIICYSCFELLQLPEDFISQKRIHRLQCSACSQVLKFSLQNRTHIIQYNPNPVVPPPSELDNSSDYPQGGLDPVSYSEDCRPSRPSSSNSEANLKRKDKPVLKQSGNNCKTSIEASESASASSNVAKLESSSMGGEVRPQPSNTALHWLMGYSSLSQIIKR